MSGDEHMVTTGEMGEIKHSINKLTSAVSNLNVNVATQTTAIQGFKDLYELEVRNIHKELSNLNDVVKKVQEHELYIAKTEAKLQTITGLIKAGWTVIGANVIAFVIYLVKDFLNNGGTNG